jgi:hypothetical protein
VVVLEPFLILVGKLTVDVTLNDVSREIRHCEISGSYGSEYEDDCLLGH